MCELPHVPGAAGTGTRAARRLRATAGVCAGSLCAWQGGWVWLGKSLPTPLPHLRLCRSTRFPVCHSAHACPGGGGCCSQLG